MEEDNKNKDAVEERLKIMEERLKNFEDGFKDIKNDMFSLIKDVRKTSKRKKSGTSKQGQHQNRFVDVDETMKIFLELDDGQYLRRKQVTKAVNTYIEKKELKCEDNGRKFRINTKLQKLFELVAKNAPTKGETRDILRVHDYICKRIIPLEKPKEEYLEKLAAKLEKANKQKKYEMNNLPADDNDNDNDDNSDNNDDNDNNGNNGNDNNDDNNDDDNNDDVDNMNDSDNV
jgi:hypothetical protein